jgi:hypothetical protein
MSTTLQAAVGWNAAADAVRAGKEAANMARNRLGTHQAQLALVFGSSWFEQTRLLEGVRQVLGETPLIGGSTAGEVTAEGPSSHSCVVVLIASDAISWSVGLGEGVQQKPREAGQQAAYAAVRNFRATPRIGFLLFGDGLATNHTEMTRGVHEVLGTGSLIVGGMTGDDLRFSQTHQYVNDRVVTNAVVGALFGGTGKLGVGMEHGFSPIGKPRRVTRAKANALLELDRQPAAKIYEEYVGPEMVQRLREEGITRQGIAYPLGLQSDDTAPWLLRNVVALQEGGGLLCNGDIEEGSWLQLMIGSKELAIDAARRAAQQAVRSLNRVALVLVFDSAGRRKLLGQEHAAFEVAQIRQIVGASTPLAGCYTYGEQAPSLGSSSSWRTASQTGSVLVVALGA